jgi:hypothetical protein
MKTQFDRVEIYGYNAVSYNTDAEEAIICAYNTFKNIQIKERKNDITINLTSFLLIL